MSGKPIEKQLNPTLWRTCRALSGHTRLHLFHHIVQDPGLNVSQLAERVGIGISDASQELRRLQSRGLLRRTCQGTSVRYLPIADPQVSSAAPLLKALQEAMAGDSAQLEAIASMAKGLGSERRVAIVRALRQGPQTENQLALLIGCTIGNLKKSLARLKDGGWVQKDGRRIALRPVAHPVGRALVGLL
jgi:DNA-binding MarR family transcriptional regulator